MIKGIVRSASQLSYVNSDKSDTRIFVQEADLKTYKKRSRSALSGETLTGFSEIIQRMDYFDTGTRLSRSAACSSVSLSLAIQTRIIFNLFFSCKKAETGMTPTPYSAASM